MAGTEFGGLLRHRLRQFEAVAGKVVGSAVEPLLQDSAG